MGEEFTEAKQASMLIKVRGLLAKAEDPASTAEEADSCRAKAEALMFKYRLDEATAVASGTSSLKPTWRDLNLDVANSEFANFYYNIVGSVLDHVGVRGEYSWSFNPETKKTGLIMQACGYSSDLSYMDILMTSAMMEFAKRLEPKYNPALSDEENVYNMRSAGMERNRIAKLVLGSWDTENQMKAKTRKVTALFKKACAERGEDPSVLLGRGNNVRTFRESYANGFISTFSTRLMRMRWAQGEQGDGLVLVGRRDKVDEMFYDRFPNRRPKVFTEDEMRKRRQAQEKQEARKRVKAPIEKINHAAFQRGSAAASLVDLGSNATGTGRVSSQNHPAL